MRVKSKCGRRFRTLALEEKTAHGRNRDDIGKGDQERKTGHPGHLRDLNDGQNFVQGDAKSIPAPAAEHPAADPFERVQTAARMSASQRLWSELSQGERASGDSLGGAFPN